MWSLTIFYDGKQKAKESSAENILGLKLVLIAQYRLENRHCYWDKYGRTLLRNDCRDRSWENWFLVVMHCIVYDF